MGKTIKFFIDRECIPIRAVDFHGRKDYSEAILTGATSLRIEWIIKHATRSMEKREILELLPKELNVSDVQLFFCETTIFIDTYTDTENNFAVDIRYGYRLSDAKKVASTLPNEIVELCKTIVFIHNYCKFEINKPTGLDRLKRELCESLSKLLLFDVFEEQVLISHEVNNEKFSIE